MLSDEIRTKLQDIVRGELVQGQTDPCTATRNILCQSFGTSPTAKSKFESKAVLKKEQVRFLKSYTPKNL
jgi:hypothetical protein